MYVCIIIILQKYKILTTCLGESASAGTGINISTSLAVDRLLNCPLAYRNIIPMVQAFSRKN